MAVSLIDQFFHLTYKSIMAAQSLASGEASPSPSASRAPPGGSGVGTYKSRKFKSNRSTGGQSTSSPTPGPDQTNNGKSTATGKQQTPQQTSPSSNNVTHKARKHLNLHAVQVALAENEDGVESMRREVSQFQEVRKEGGWGWVGGFSIPAIARCGAPGRASHFF